jgi:hypothetical protein
MLGSALAPVQRLSPPLRLGRKVGPLYSGRAVRVQDGHQDEQSSNNDPNEIVYRCPGTGRAYLIVEKRSFAR